MRLRKPYFSASFALALLFFINFSNCEKDKLPPPKPSECDSIPVYVGQIQPIIDHNCSFAGCHDGTGAAPGDFTSYAGMESRLNNGKIMDRAITIQDMPEAPFTMTLAHFDSLKCWLENGFPEN